MIEVWRQTHLSERHEVSNLGRVRSWVLWGSTKAGARASTPRIMRTRASRGGYILVGVMNARAYRMIGVHTLVLTAFVGPRPTGKECRHLDGDQRNNWLDNLCWGTKLENGADRRALGRGRGPRPKVAGMLNGRAVKDLELIRAVAQAEGTCVGVARRFAIGRTTVKNIRDGLHRTQLAGLV